MPLRRFPIILLLLPLLAGCPAPCRTPSIGKPSGTPGAAPAALWPGVLMGDALFALRDGDTVPQERPVQGGHVLFVGAFLQNVRGCGALRGELRRLGDGGAVDPPGPLIAADERTTELTATPAGTPPPGVGWGATDPALFAAANVPACPNVQPFDLVDQPLVLRMTYTEPGESSPAASASLRVVPRCTQRDADRRARCQCECQASYSPERCFQSRDAASD